MQYLSLIHISDYIYSNDPAATGKNVTELDISEQYKTNVLNKNTGSMKFKYDGIDYVSMSRAVSYTHLLTINLTNYSVVCDGHPVDMPPKELELLYFLAASPNQVFTREQLLDQIWGYEYIGDTRTVDVHIKRLREKIKDHPSWGLSTVWGIGYKFEVK